MATATIRSYKRRSPKGKIVKVRRHKRRIRALGKKVTFRKVGEFFVGMDEKGNLRGSKIKLTKKRPQPRRRRPKIYRSTRELDIDFQRGVITPKDFIDARLRLSGRN